MDSNQLVCTMCRKQFPPVNNGDDVSPCCNAQGLMLDKYVAYRAGSLDWYHAPSNEERTCEICGERVNPREIISDGSDQWNAKHRICYEVLMEDDDEKG